MLKLILDTILPGDDGLGLPAASSIVYGQSLDGNVSPDIVKDFIGILQTISLKAFNRSFDQLGYSERLKAIYDCRIASIRIFTSFLTYVLKTYYSDQRVLTTILAGTIPPFPQGNMLENTNWDLLEPVYKRGIIYRECK